MTARPIDLYTTRGQFICVLLATLSDLSDRIPSKGEVERHIEKHGYLRLTPDFLQRSYNSKTEPKWKTELAMARRDAINRELLKPLTVRDAWEISEKGSARVAKLQESFKNGKLDISRCNFLASAFLERMGVVNKP